MVSVELNFKSCSCSIQWRKVRTKIWCFGFWRHDFVCCRRKREHFEMSENLEKSIMLEVGYAFFLLLFEPPTCIDASQKMNYLLNNNNKCVFVTVGFIHGTIKIHSIDSIAIAIAKPFRILKMTKKSTHSKNNEKKIASSDGWKITLWPNKYVLFYK